MQLLGVDRVFAAPVILYHIAFVVACYDGRIRFLRLDGDVLVECYLFGYGGNIQIQLWQIIGGGSQVFFAHGIMNKETSSYTHFDLATHYIDPIEIPKLLDKKERMNLIRKIKWLRIDGELNETQVFDMIGMFFPLDYLVDEFKETDVLKNNFPAVARDHTQQK